MPTFYARFASMAAPNFYWFDDDGNPNLDTELGIKCATEHAALKAWSQPGLPVVDLRRGLRRHGRRPERAHVELHQLLPSSTTA